MSTDPTNQTTRSASWKGRLRERKFWQRSGLRLRRVRQSGRWCFVTDYAGRTLDQWWEPAS